MNPLHTNEYSERRALEYVQRCERLRRFDADARRALLIAAGYSISIIAIGYYAYQYWRLFQ